jgi:hypothetical protein
LARILIVGCGCRGRSLGRTLATSGHAFRGTSRDGGRRASVRAAGGEPFAGDPDRVGTLTAALDNVTLVCWLLGSAQGSRAEMEALHGPRLRAFCERLVDTSVRGFLYEASGKVDDDILARGRDIALEAERTWQIPVGMLDVDPGTHTRWLEAARGAVNRMLGAGSAFRGESRRVNSPDKHR